MNYNASMLPTKYGAPAAQGNYMEYAHKFDARAQLTDQSILTQSGAAVTGIAGTSYEYDSAGNRTKKGTASYTANGLNQITAWTYDLDGNLLGDGTWTYTYDANNRIRTMAKATSGADSYLRFTYDYMGRRAKKEVWDNNTGSGAAARTILFVYRGMDLLAELDSSMELIRSFYWGLDISGTIGGAGGAMGLNYLYDWGTDQGYYPSYDASGNVARLRDRSMDPMAKDGHRARAWAVGRCRWSATAWQVGLLDSSGAWKAWYAYSAFGEVLKQDTSGGTYARENPIGFSTQYTDRETGLVYYGYRYYDPAKGRFARRDPIGERGGLNLYRFVGNNPLSNVDVRGLESEPIFAGEIEGFTVYADPPQEPDTTIPDYLNQQLLDSIDAEIDFGIERFEVETSGESRSNPTAGTAPTEKKNKRVPKDWLKILCSSAEGRALVQRLGNREFSVREVNLPGLSTDLQDRIGPFSAATSNEKDGTIYMFGSNHSRIRRFVRDSFGYRGSTTDFTVSTIVHEVNHFSTSAPAGAIPGQEMRFEEAAVLQKTDSQLPQYGLPPIFALPSFPDYLAIIPAGTDLSTGEKTADYGHTANRSVMSQLNSESALYQGWNCARVGM